MVIHKNKILVFILLVPNIALANIGASANTTYISAKITMNISLFVAIISLLIIIVSQLFLGVKKFNKKRKTFLIIGVALLSISFIVYTIANAVKNNNSQFMYQQFGIEDITNSTPCNERSTVAIPKGGEGVNCLVDNLCRLITVPSCDTCQDTVWVCVER